MNAKASKKGTENDHAEGQMGNSQKRGASRQYCTQRCIRGLVRRKQLDKKCSNVEDHGDEKHAINQFIFLRLLQGQLTRDRDVDCEPLYIQGARGVMFKVTLTSYGYTVVAKATVDTLVRYLQYEVVIYKKLRSLQGVCISICVGAINLVQPYYYNGAKIVHMLFLGWAGTQINRHINYDNEFHVLAQATRSLGAIHRLGLLHRDALARNMLWNEECSRVMVVDFERAVSQVIKCTALGSTSNQRSTGKDHKTDDDDFAREVRSARVSLSECVKR